jgi:hypothetical protein
MSSRISRSNAARLASDMGSYGTRNRENGRPALVASCSASNAASNASAVSSHIWAGFRAAYLIAYPADRMMRNVIRASGQAIISAVQMSVNSLK